MPPVFVAIGARPPGPDLFDRFPPQDFVRLVTILLAIIWSVRGAFRLWRQIQELDALATDHGLRPGLALRASVDVALATTIFDPLNLSLILLLAGLWTI